MEQQAIIDALLASEAALEACAYQIAQLSKNNRQIRKQLEGHAVELSKAQVASAGAGQRFLKNINRKIAKRA